MRWLPQRLAQRRSRSWPASRGRARRFLVCLRLEYLEERRAPAVLHQGDLVLADPIAGASHTGALIQVDFTTHNQTVIASGGSFLHPTGVLYAADGNLLVANQGANQILRVNPANGAQTSISAGGSLISPTGLATAGNSDIYVADQGIFGSNNGLILKIDPSNGAQMVVARGGMLVTPTGVVASNNGLLYVVDPRAVVPGGTGGVLSINLKTGAQAVVASGGFFKAPTGITRDVDGTLLVADPGRPGNDGQILRINPANGAQTVISANGSLFDPTGVAVEAIGMVAIADAHAANAAGGGALRVSLLGTGAQSTVTTGNNFAGPFGICVVPEQDAFPTSAGQVTLKNVNTGQSFLVNLSGPTTVHVTIGPIGQAADRDANNRDEVATEITAFNLTGTTPLGQVNARLRAGYRSFGQIEERTNGHPGILDLPPFEPGPLQADSFFDMIVEVVVAGAVFHPANPLHLTSVITSKPPGQGVFYQTIGDTIPLLDQNDQPTPFQLVHSQHTPNPFPTNTSLRSMPNPSQLGQPVTFTAHVSTTGGTLTGTVNFLDGTTILNPDPISVNGTGDAIFTTSSLASCSHTITAVYSGDGTHLGSTSNIVNQIVFGNGFLPTVNYPTGPGPNGVAVGDFNGDGIPDLAVTNSNGTVSILLGTGDGTFQPPRNIAVGTGTLAIAAGDFNGDGIIDLAVTNFQNNNVSILLGTGDGAFLPPVSYAVGRGPVAVAVADLNGDGFPDLVTANSGDNTVSVLLNNGDGTFQTSVSYPVGQAPVAVAVADFNGDGVLDLVTANNGSNNVSVLLGIGDGTFQPPQNYAVGRGPVAVAVADVNGDGIPDLVTTNSGDGTVSVLLGNGDGTFQPPMNSTVGPTPSFVVVADFNGDGIPDLAVGNRGANLVNVFLGNGDGTFQTPQCYGTDMGPVAAAVGDFNLDGLPDLAVANVNSNDVSILLNTGAWSGPRSSRPDHPGIRYNTPARAPGEPRHPTDPSAGRVLASLLRPAPLALNHSAPVASDSTPVSRSYDPWWRQPEENARVALLGQTTHGNDAYFAVALHPQRAPDPRADWLPWEDLFESW